MGLVPVSSPFLRLMNFSPLTRCSRYVPMAMGCRWAAKSVKRIPGVLCAPRSARRCTRRNQTIDRSNRADVASIVKSGVLSCNDQD